MGDDVDSAVEVLTDGRCWEKLRSGEFGRLAVSVADRPEIFPVNYTVDAGDLLIRTEAGTKLAALTVNPAVAFEIDGFDRAEGWSVVVLGRAEAEQSFDRVYADDETGLRPWVPTPKTVYVRITPDSVSGRRFRFGDEPERY